MNAVVSGLESIIRTVIEASDERPVVTAPSTAVLAAAARAGDSTGGTRLVVSPEAWDTAGWPTLGLLADVVDHGPTSVRVGPTEVAAAAASAAVGVVDDSVSPPAAPVAPPSSEVVERYESRWREAVPREIDTTRRSEVVAAVRSAAAAADADTAAADAAVADVRSLSRAARGDGADAIKVAVWAAARSDPTLSTLADSLSNRLAVCDRTVRRHVRDLSEAGVVSLRPATDDNSRGRPPSVVSRPTGSSLTAVGRSQLLLSRD